METHNGVTQRSSPQRSGGNAHSAPASLHHGKQSTADTNNLVKLNKIKSFSKDHSRARRGFLQKATKRSSTSVFLLFSLNVYLYFTLTSGGGSDSYPLFIQTKLPEKTYLRPRRIEDNVYQPKREYFTSEPNADDAETGDGTSETKEEPFDSSPTKDLSKLPIMVRLGDTPADSIKRLPLLANVKYFKHREIPYHKNESPLRRSADPLPKKGCELMADWQVAYNPTCSVLHEIDLTLRPYSHRHIRKTYKYDASRLVAQGSYRDVWMVREWNGFKVALKTLLYQHRIDDYRHYERHRKDAVAMEQLTASPLVSDIYAFCGNSVVVDYADGGDLNKVLKTNHTPRELVKIGYDIAASVADAHHFDKGRATMVHTDLNPNNWVLMNGGYKLNDFNRAEFVQWNSTADEQCPFFHSRAGGPWRSPEEYRFEAETEKVDVYSVGNVLHYLLVPFKHKYWPGYIGYNDWIKQVAKNKGAEIPRTIRNSTDPYTLAMVKAIDLALEPDAKKRASARDVADVMKAALEIKQE